jgi:hypothetical protein
MPFEDIDDRRKAGARPPRKQIFATYVGRRVSLEAYPSR